MDCCEINFRPKEQPTPPEPEQLPYCGVTELNCCKHYNGHGRCKVYSWRRSMKKCDHWSKDKPEQQEKKNHRKCLNYPCSNVNHGGEGYCETCDESKGYKPEQQEKCDQRGTVGCSICYGQNLKCVAEEPSPSFSEIAEDCGWRECYGQKRYRCRGRFRKGWQDACTEKDCAIWHFVQRLTK